MSTRRLERALAVTGTVLCLVVSFGAWWGLRVQQSLWPLPDLYLLEATAASALAAWGIWNTATGSSSVRLILTWAAIGAILGFLVLAGFSIGNLYLPVAGLLFIAAILADLRLKSNLLVHLGVACAAAVVQAALMLAIIRMI